MNALLKPLTVRPAIKPTYLNRNLVSFSAWYRDNEPALGEYWLSLGPADQAYHEGDFRDFVLCQYDIESELQAEARRTVCGEPNEGRSWDAETQMADFRG
jgi:hypothetical protein